MIETKNFGKRTEDLVSTICNKMFFSDFTVKNPFYEKQNGEKREIADILVSFDNYLLVIQVKSKIEEKPGYEKTAVEFDRIKRVITKGIKQLKTVLRAIKNGWIKQLKTGKGFEINFDSISTENIIGLVILDLIGEEVYDKEDRTQLVGNFQYYKDMPVFILMRDEFEVISTELDTMPDFIEFLDLIQKLYEKGLLHIPPDILDLLAIFKIDPERIKEAVNQTDNIVIVEGLWNSYQKEHKEAIDHRNELNRPSYYVDTIINFLHTSVGFSYGEEKLKELGIPGGNDVNDYLVIARELAKLSRLNRRLFGQRLERCLETAEKHGEGYSMVYDETTSSAYMIFASKDPREKRIEKLYLLGAIAYCKYSLKKIVGISTENLSTKLRSYDGMLLEDVVFENSDELAEASKYFFGESYQAKGTEYTSGNE